MKVHAEVLTQYVKTPRSTFVRMISVEIQMFFRPPSIQIMPPCTSVLMTAALEDVTGLTDSVEMDK